MSNGWLVVYVVYVLLLPLLILVDAVWGHNR